MKHLNRLLLLFAFVGCFSFVGFTQQVTVRIRPVPPVMVRPAPPSPRHLWIDGEWVVRNGRYVWVDGFWANPRPGMVWVAGGWRHRRGGWVWIPGHWRRRF